MQIVDPNIKPKSSPSKLKGGEDFDAEPGLEKPSDKWMDVQIAKLKLTLNLDGHWGNELPELNTYPVWSEKQHGPEWDDEENRYYVRSYMDFKIQYRYYKGSKKRSYLFWPKHVQPGWSLRNILRHLTRGTVFRVRCSSGWADYVPCGSLEETDRWGSVQRTEVLALWRSHGTMKPRRTKNADTT